MKSIKRLFGNQSARPREDIGSSNEPPRTSVSGSRGPRRRSTSTRPRQQIEAGVVMERNVDGPYRVLVDRTKHISNIVEQRSEEKDFEIQIRATWHSAADIYGIMARDPLFAEVKNYVDNTGIASIFGRRMPNSDRALVEACILRWWDTTHTFHLPTCELGFTPFDFTVITGIPVGLPDKVQLEPYNDGEILKNADNMRQFLETYFPESNRSHIAIRKGCIRGSGITKYLKWCLHEDNFHKVGAEATARVFCFFIIGYVFFPNASSAVPVGWMNYLLDMDNVGKYDWGSAIMGRIYACLDANSRKEIQSVNCFWQVIEFFFYEYFGTASPVLRDPHVDVFPRMHKWVTENHNWDISNIVRFNLDVANQQIEMRSIQSVLWQPYATSQVLNLHIVQMAMRVSMVRYILLDPQTGGYWYLGDRCYHQIAGYIAIPADPPQPMGRLPRALFTYFAEREWPQCSNYVKITGVEEYSRYWREVSTGPLLAPLTRGVNIDVIGYAALVDGDVQLPCPPHNFEGTVYDTQGGSSSQPIPFDWSYKAVDRRGDVNDVQLPRVINEVSLPPANALTKDQWRNAMLEAFTLIEKLKAELLQKSIEDIVNSQSNQDQFSTQHLDED